MASTAGTSAELSSALAKMAEFLSATSYEDLPEAVRKQAGLVVQDTFGAILAGSLEPEMRALTERMAAHDANREATVICPGFRRLSAPVAAMLNGAAGTFLELDEGNRPRGHPGIHVLPAVLALGERLHSPGERVVEALVLGYEAVVRVSRGCRLRSVLQGHGHMGTVGAAVGCGKLLGFDAARMAQAINISSSLSLGSPARTTHAGATVRDLFAGISNRMGMLAADATGSGFTGIPDGLQQTFGIILGDGFDPAPLSEGLGDSYAITSNYFKIHACCAFIHSTLDAALELLHEHGFRPEDVAEVRVISHHYAARMANAEPANQLAAKFSVPFAVATTLVHGDAGTRAFQPEAVANPAIRTLASRVNVSEDPKLSAEFPAQSGARVGVKLTDGRTLEGSCANPRGYYGNPISEEELAAKFASVVAPVFATTAQAKVALALTRLAECGDVAEWTATLG